MKKSILVFLLVIFLVPVGQLNLWGEEGETYTPLEEKNMNLVKRLIDEAWNQGKLEVVDEILSPDCIVTVNHFQVPQPGPEPMKKEIAMKKNDCTLLKVTIHDIFAKGNKVTIRFILEKREKKYNNILFTYYCIGIFQFSEGKLVNLWYVFDISRILRQAGFKIIPPGKTGQ